MQWLKILVPIFVVSVLSFQAGAVEVKTLNVGNAEIVYDYETTETGMAILTLNAVVSETNNSLRGLKNSDQRRLSKLGQLIYQCKLMLYKPAKTGDKIKTNDPILISNNFSLYTGVDATLAADERMGIRVQALQSIDDNSLFSPSLGKQDSQKGMWGTLGEGSAIGLRQFDVNILKESDIIGTSENIDIIVRFPVFQVERPVREWSYNFSLQDFKQAVRHTDANCTPAMLKELINRSS